MALLRRVPRLSLRRLFTCGSRASAADLITPFPLQVQPRSRSREDNGRISFDSLASMSQPLGDTSAFKLGRPVLSHDKLLSFVFSEFTPCPPQPRKAGTYWIAFDSIHPGVWDESCHMQSEILEDGTTFHTTSDYHEAWRIWQGGCLSGKVDPLVDISDNSIFPRVVLDAHLEEFLRQRHNRALQRYGSSITTETLALGVSSLDEAWNVMRDIYMHDSPFSQVINFCTSTNASARGSLPLSSSLPRQGPPSETTIVVESAYGVDSPPFGENVPHHLASPALHANATSPSLCRLAVAVPSEGSTLQKAHHMFFATGRRVVDLHLLSPSFPHASRTSATPTSFVTNPSDIAHVSRLVPEVDSIPEPHAPPASSASSVKYFSAASSGYEADLRAPCVPQSHTKQSIKTSSASSVRVGEHESASIGDGHATLREAIASALASEVRSFHRHTHQHRQQESSVPHATTWLVHIVAMEGGGVRR